MKLAPARLAWMAMRACRAGFDAPVDLHRLVELALAQQPEIFRYRAAPVLEIAGPHPLHAEHLDRQRRMRLERVREQHALAFDHLPELVVAADPGPAHLVFDRDHVLQVGGAHQHLRRIAAHPITGAMLPMKPYWSASCSGNL